MPAVVSIENLSKRFRVPTVGEDTHRTLRDELMRFWARRGAPEYRWALRDLTFEVGAGEVVGIIGRNGAGKSTLLKILARITPPTSGRVVLDGRVGSLLEIGTGFHMELTGRENIFLNGAILGMSRREIRRRFTEIVDFAELGDWLELPVKRYSSGMYMRLAFAVAASLDTRILLIDEALAVGDAAFQRKCLDRIGRAGSEGKTVLLISHDLAALSRLCGRVLLLDNQRLMADGPADQVVQRYLTETLRLRVCQEWQGSHGPGDQLVHLLRVCLTTGNGPAPLLVNVADALAVEVDYEVRQMVERLVVVVHFLNGEGLCLFSVPDRDPTWHWQPRPSGRYRTRVALPENFLAEGAFHVGVTLANQESARVHCHVAEALSFRVVDAGTDSSARGLYGGSLPGSIRPLFRWETERLPLAG